MFLLTSMALAGCGGKDNGGSDTAGTKTDSTGSEAKSTEKEKPVKLIWYTISGPQKDQDKVMAEVNKYVGEKSMPKSICA